MIIVSGWVRLKLGALADLRPHAVSMIAESLKEPGCIDYAYSVDFGDPDLVRIIELWRDDAALAAHFATPHMAAFNAALAKVALAGASVKSYSAELQRTLMGGEDARP